jgi:von Willebrand factor type A domain-containing protein
VDMQSASGAGPRRRTRRRTLLATGALIVCFLAITAWAAASLSPVSATLTINAGSSGTETKTVGVPAVPPKADIEIAIDTTGSMQPSIDQAKADAQNIVNGVQGVVLDSQFAIVQFKDSGDSPEYQVVQGMTGSASAVQTAINGLSANGGGDDPEAHNLVFHNSFTPAVGGAVGWRSGTRKFVVVISDAEPHGAGSAGVAGCSDSSADPHGLNTATELAGMKAAQRTLLLIRQVSGNTTTSLACYKGLAAGGFDGGDAVNGGGSLAGQIVSLIQAAFANVANVHLEVASASPAPASASWISFSPASVGPVPAPSTQTFTLTATVPASTPAGIYSFDIVAKADGVDIGHQQLTVVVTRPTKLVYSGDTTADYHDPATLAGTLTDAASGTPIAGQPLSLSMGSQGCNATTNAAGKGSCTITVNQPAGPQTATATFAGTQTLLPSSGSAPFTITREETTLAYTGTLTVANGTPAHMAGVLKEDGVVPIAGRTVSFTLGSGASAQSCSGTTNAAGSASCDIASVSQPLVGPGNVPIAASFAGDAFYLPASASATAKLVYMTGQAFAAKVKALNLLNLIVADTGPVKTPSASSIAKSTISLSTPIVSANGLGASVTTTLAPGKSVAEGHVADITVAAPLLALIKAKVISATSQSTCAGSSGTTTIERLQVGPLVVVSSSLTPAPNSTISLPGGGKVVLNEQIPGPGELTVNAVHVTLPGPLGLLGVDLVLASARSDIHNCA